MRRAPRLRPDAGQSTTEMMLMMSFLSLFIVGAVHLSMFAVTRYMVNYAAFTAARTVMVRAANPGPIDIPILGQIAIDIPLDWRLQAGWPAAAAVLSGLKWSSGWQGLPGFIRGGAPHHARRHVFTR